MTVRREHRLECRASHCAGGEEIDSAPRPVIPALAAESQGVRAPVGRVHPFPYRLERRLRETARVCDFKQTGVVTGRFPIRIGWCGLLTIVGVESTEGFGVETGARLETGSFASPHGNHEQGTLRVPGVLDDLRRPASAGGRFPVPDCD